MRRITALAERLARLPLLLFVALYQIVSGGLFTAAIVWFAASGVYHLGSALGFAPGLAAVLSLQAGYLALGYSAAPLEMTLVLEGSGWPGAFRFVGRLFVAMAASLVAARGLAWYLTEWAELGEIGVGVVLFFAFAIGVRGGMEALAPSLTGGTVHLAGAQLITPETALENVRSSDEDARITFWWGGVRYPLAVAVRHLIAWGTTGSGKSTFLYPVIRSLVRFIGRLPEWRALVFDGKGGLLDDLHTMDIASRIVSLDATDARGLAWDVARDAGTIDGAEQLAAAMARVMGGAAAPEDSNGRYFENALQTVIQTVIVTLGRHAPGRWRLRHLVCILQDWTLLTHVLNHAPTDISGMRTARSYLMDQNDESKRSGEDVFSTVLNCAARFARVAALWEHAHARNGAVSVRDWAESADGFVLVLGHDARSESVLQPINRALVEFAGQCLLARPDADPPDRFTLLALDELPLLGPIRILPELLSTGRSKAVCVLASAQSFNQLVARYTNPGTLALAGLFNTWFIGQCKPETAGPVSEQYIGSAETGRWNPGMSQGGGSSGGSSSLSWVQERKPLVLPDTIASLPNCNPVNGLSCYVGSTAAGGTYFHHVSGFELERHVWSRTRRRGNRRRTPWDDPSLQELRPLIDDDWAFLGIPAPPRDNGALPDGAEPPMRSQSPGGGGRGRSEAPTATPVTPATPRSATRNDSDDVLAAVTARSGRRARGNPPPPQGDGGRG